MSYFIVRLQARGDKDHNFLYASSSGKLTTQKKHAYHFKLFENAEAVARIYGKKYKHSKYIAEVLIHET